MKKSIYDFETKYDVQDELLNEGALEGLDKRTLHETIKAMLINTTKDCIKYESRTSNYRGLKIYLYWQFDFYSYY